MSNALQLLRSTASQVRYLHLFGINSYLRKRCSEIIKNSMCTQQSISKPRLPTTSLDQVKRWVNLQFEGKNESKKYPFVWLRDNCGCPECYHPVSSQRLLQFSDLDIDVIAKDIQVIDGTVFIDWSDGHKGEYSLSFLEGENFPSFSDPIREVKQEPWGSELQNCLPKFDFTEILTNDESLFGWLDSLHRKGIAIVENAGKELGAIEKIGDRVGHIRKTCYGNVFHVMSKNDPNSITYTGSAIDYHTDLCSFNNQPGMQMLHCIKQSAAGGSNILVDLLKAVGDLKEKDPDIHDLLTTTLIEFTDIGTDFNDFHFRSSKPTISYDAEGRLKQVSIHFGRHPSMNVPAEQVYSVYHALKVFFSYMYKEENIVRHKLSEGEIICMDNRRMAHGRTEYKIDPSIEGIQRQLEGGYIDWDELSSFYRVLLERFKKLKQE